MIFINSIRSILILLFLYSCQSIPYSQFPIIVKGSIYGAEDIVVDESMLAEKRFSFIKVRFGKEFIAVLSLVNISNNVFEWISSNGERIFTYKGKVIKTVGLVHNMHIYSYDDFSCFTNESRKLYYDVMLEDPKAFINQSSSIIKDPLEEVGCYESIVTNEFKWAFKNQYRYGKNGLPSRSFQSIHPMLPAVEINFFYKY